jgi:hypothetical protein
VPVMLLLLPILRAHGLARAVRVLLQSSLHVCVCCGVAFRRAENELSPADFAPSTEVQPGRAFRWLDHPRRPRHVACTTCVLTAQSAARMRVAAPGHPETFGTAKMSTNFGGSEVKRGR